MTFAARKDGITARTGNSVAIAFVFCPIRLRTRRKPPFFNSIRPQTPDGFYCDDALKQIAVAADTDYMATTTAPFVIWNQSWCIGVKNVDAQHQNLVALVNKLHQAMSEGKGKNVLEEILGSLVTYTKAHFRDEERMMEQNGYPDLVEHRRQHVLLTQKVLDFQTEFKSGATGMSIDIMEFLSTWLKGHILGTDAKYVALMYSKGVR